MRADYAAPAGAATPGFLHDQPRPRVVIKADLLPSLSLLSLVALLGLPVGWLWSRIAPPEQNQLTAGGAMVPLPADLYHRFTDLALFVLLTAAAGVLTGAAVWMLRRRRGPVMLLATVAGSCVAAWLASRTGVSLAGALYPMPPEPVLGQVVVRAPRLDSPWAVLAQPTAAALVYGLATAWNGMDDLGRRLS